MITPYYFLPDYVYMIIHRNRCIKIAHVRKRIFLFACDLGSEYLDKVSEIFDIDMVCCIAVDKKIEIAHSPVLSQARSSHRRLSRKQPEV